MKDEFLTQNNNGLCSNFYSLYHLGRVLFDYEFKVYNGKYTEVTAGGYRPPAIESLNPYPSQFIYENIRNFGGIMWAS